MFPLLFVSKTVPVSCVSKYKVVGGAKEGINYSINGLCMVSATSFASAADNVKVWSIVS